MEVLVTYDVATDSVEGRRRLRRVAHACEAYGQRVQKSVFECVVSQGDLELLIARLRAEIDETADSVRVYRLREPVGRHVLTFGTRPGLDLRGPLVV